MVWEKTALLEAARGKEAEADQKASILWGELVAMHQEWDAAEETVSSLVTETVVANSIRKQPKNSAGAWLKNSPS
jgi:hypothetical protein